MKYYIRCYLYVSTSLIMLSWLLVLPRIIRCHLSGQKHEKNVLPNAEDINISRIFTKQLNCSPVDQCIWISLNTLSISSRGKTWQKLVFQFFEYCVDKYPKRLAWTSWGGILDPPGRTWVCGCMYGCVWALRGKLLIL